MISMQRFTGKLGGRDGTIVGDMVCRSRIGAVNSPGFGAKEVLKATLEKGLTDGWIIGSKEAVNVCKDKADQMKFGSI
jgi:hypothetical protein